MRPALRVLSLLFSTAIPWGLGCGSGGSSSSGGSGGAGNGGSGGAGGTVQTVTKCYDASAKPTDTCALTPTGDFCDLGDANACTPLSLMEVYADDGTSGVCLHLVFEVTCDQEAYSYTCIEHQDPPDMQPTWQCWTSSTLPGFQIDLSQCHATGNFFHVASTSSGKLDIDEMKCPAPPI